MPITLGDLSGILTRPEPLHPLDFSPLIQAEQFRQKQQLAQQELAQERAKLYGQLQMHQASEMGRMQRAQDRNAFQREKFDFEKSQAGLRHGEEQRKAREAIYSQLVDAHRRGDTESEEYARQQLARLGGDVGAETATPRLPGASTQLSLQPAPEAAAPTEQVEAHSVPSWLTGYMASQGESPQPEQQAPVEAQSPSNATGGSQQPAPPQGLNPGGLNGLTLGKSGTDLDAIDTIFAPRIQAARNAKERRAAELGQQTARAVAQRLGVQEGIKAGQAAYDKELGLEAQRDTANIRAQGMVASAGRAEASGQRADQKFAQKLLKEREDSVRQDYGVKSIGEAEAGLDRLEGMLATGSGFGDQAALTNALRSIGGEKGPLSNQDISRWQKAGGLVSEFENKINYVTKGGQLNDAFKRSLKALTLSTRRALQERRREAAQDAYDRVNELAVDWDDTQRERYALQVARQFDRSFKAGSGRAAQASAPAPATKPAAKPKGNTSERAKAFFFGQ